MTPDGETLVFVAVDDSDVKTMYSVPTDGSGANAEPTVLGTWTSGGPSQIVGWRLPDGGFTP